MKIIESHAVLIIGHDDKMPAEFKICDGYMDSMLQASSRAEFRQWLEENANTQSECWVNVKRGKPLDDGLFYYLDAVEEALCFGWIDSTQKVMKGIRLQRFSPRKKNSPWTELNKERARRLEKLGLMTDAGRAALPPNESP